MIFSKGLSSIFVQMKQLQLINFDIQDDVYGRVTFGNYNLIINR